MSDAYGLAHAYTITGKQYSGDYIISAAVTWNQGANGYRLPTEAEREYACRAGSTTAFCDGATTDTLCGQLDPDLDRVGWYCGNAGGATHPVKDKQPNAWGLYDMHGNVWEWCWDTWDGSDYGSGPATDPTGRRWETGVRIVRGGYWNADARDCRSAVRRGGITSVIYYSIGLRVARTAP